MTPPPQTPNPTEDRLQVMQTRWKQYVAEGQFEQFIEFSVALNSLTEHFNRLRLPGLVRLCEGLENAILDKTGDKAAHPIEKQEILALQRQIDTLLASAEISQAPIVEKRAHEPAGEVTDSDLIKPRSVWMIAAPEKSEVADTLSHQLQFFGFKIFRMGWKEEQPFEDMPLAVLFIPAKKDTRPDEFTYIATIRASCPTSQLFYIGVQSLIEPIVSLIRSGIDVTIPAEEPPLVVLNRILDLVQTDDKQKSRVLIVEDSQVAVKVIERTMAEHDIDTRAINDPSELLNELESYRPDLVLMDMYMPRFNGIEATRVLRQMAEYNSLPIVYLSAESEVGMQVEALRLGGDQFLSKPFNPVLLAAVVQTKIERYRETQRSTHLDGLTGLLNHTAAKSLLKNMVNKVSKIGTSGALTVAMIDIDNFKSVNDTYGHPAGDQVIRGLAWLLKGRLRSSDLIGRYGGEEFLIALPDISPDQAFSVIDRIRADFSTLPHTHADGSLHATFSAGMTSYPDFYTAADLTEAADGALLQAKRLGRNRVEKAVIQTASKSA